MMGRMKVFFALASDYCLHLIPSYTLWAAMQVELFSEDYVTLRDWDKNLKQFSAQDLISEW